MRVVVADKLPANLSRRLVDAGFEVVSRPADRGASLVASLLELDPDVLVVRSTKVDAEAVTAAPRLSLVVRAGAGVNTIAVDYCAGRGVYVANCPGRNAVAVAELTMGLIVALDRRIPDNVSRLRKGEWAKGEFANARGLHGATLGLLGFGQIGQEVARRALAFGMEVVAWSRSLNPAVAASHGVACGDSPEDVARRADMLSLHLALTDQTRGLVDAALLGVMKPHAALINTARAGLLDDSAVIEAIEARGLRVALDVFTDEPSVKAGTCEDVLARHPAVYGTHHIGASTEQAQDAVASEVCRIIERYGATGQVLNCVNLAERSGADHGIVVRHLDRVGVLAGVLDELQRDGINVEEMENIVFAGGEAASARLHVHGAPSDDLLQRIRARPHVLSVGMVRLGR